MGVVVKLLERRRRDHGPHARRAIWQRLGDLLGRLATVLALLFIIYGLVATRQAADDAHKTAGHAASAARDARRTAGGVAELLRESQEGRRRAVLQSCHTNNRQNAAIRGVLRRFHVRAAGFDRIDCQALLRTVAPRQP